MYNLIIAWWRPVVIIESIKLLGKVGIHTGLVCDLSNYEMSYILPYVLNRPIYTILFEIFTLGVQVDIFHNYSMLQG